VLAEQHDDEWIEGRCYLGLDVLSRARAALTGSDHSGDQQPGHHTGPHRPKPRLEESCDPATSYTTLLDLPLGAI
jgi:hypothetical protein